MIPTELEGLSEEKKKELLKEVFENDVSYWEKIHLLMNMEDNNGMLDMVIDNKRAEMDLLNNEKTNVEHFRFEELYNRNNLLKLDEIFEKENLKYSKACKEVIEVLSYIPEKFYAKIDSDFIKKLNDFADDKHKFKILPNQNISDIELLEETKDILAAIMKKYWENEEENILEEKNLEDSIKEESIPEIGKKTEQLMCKENFKWYKKIFRLFKIK